MSGSGFENIRPIIRPSKYLPVDAVALLLGVCNFLVVAVDVIGIEFVDDTTKIGPENIFWLMFLIDLR